ncbi:hydroxypyruvate isomerase family protein [Neorhodopirellula pilleata]|uniref:Hydroxypyruvate isomerase n=1 Tax=Neorhodopirellula pilleata TaxID=2714738 RepID=A0A5C6A0E2_9BACT|nr:TIM barrel protein [Neorhodopirellula pilleata]TWT93039.1 Hydroxypyruvate isomerase [Neorhodopirellula pilleata]
MTAAIPSRRSFLHAAFATTALAGLSRARSFAEVVGSEASTKTNQAEKFKLAYAPHPGMFKASAGNDVLDQIRFMADQGFTALEYNGLPSESPEMQTKIGDLLGRLDMQMGVFVAYGNFDSPTFARPDEDSTTEILTKMKDAVEISKRVNAKWCTVVPGSVDQQNNAGDWNRYGGARLAEGYQTANVIDMLRRCVDVIEPSGLVMVLEPLNWYANHGGTFLQRSDQAYAICRAVDSPSCKILFDIYHQQITEGNLIPNIDACWDEIAYFQSGDNPGRNEPYTGEINYRNVFAHIHSKGYQGVIGMEHGNSEKGIDGERKVIEAYRRADQF